MLTPEQHRIRHRGIGGSDAAAALGISPWKSQYELYVEKTSPNTRASSTPPTPEQEWGLLLEDAVATKFAADQGVALYDMKQTIVSDRYPFMLGTPDRIIMPSGTRHTPTFDGQKLAHADGILEIKTARSDYGWGEPGTDQVPLHYLVQVVHYCVVTDQELAYVAALFNGNDFRVYQIRPADDLRRMVIESEAAFWKRVEDHEPPPLVTPNDVRLAYLTDTGREVEAEPDIVKALEDYLALKGTIARAAEEMEQHEQTLQRFMKDAAYLTVGGVRVVSWRNVAPSNRIDTKLLRERYPDIAAEVSKLSAGSRRFALCGTTAAKGKA